MIVNGRRILRVFPEHTSHTPEDDYAVIRCPQVLPPGVEEVHISCCFTWQREQCEGLERLYGQVLPGVPVKLGGPAVDEEPPGEFTPGLYLKPGITFTSRGCPNRCPWCLVPEREGGLRELEMQPGHIIQDNNFLACSRGHRGKVYDMLSRQSKIEFAGGLDAKLLTSWDVEMICSLQNPRGQSTVRELWFAADTDYALEHLEQAADLLRGFGRELTPAGRRRKLRCFVLCAYGPQTPDQARSRLGKVWDLGFLPFAQLYQPPEEFIEYPDDWKRLQNVWTRPARMFAQHKEAP